jgi:uncharacterized secreted protein with C-terminal beta-propeller domain
LLGRTTLIAALALACAACGNGVSAKERAAAARRCTAARPASSVPLSSGFPAPSSIVYTGSSTSGSSTVVTGYVPGTIAVAVADYEGAFSANNFQVTKETQHTDDAEFRFSGTNVDGSVDLLQACRSRTAVTITVAPA